MATAALAPLAEALARGGIDPGPFLGRFGLADGDLRVPHRRIPLGAVRGIWQAAASELRDPLFGLRTGLAAGPHGAQWLPGLDPACREPVAAARTCSQAFNGLFSSMHCHVAEREDEITFVREPVAGASSPEDLRHATEFLVSAAYSFSRRFDLGSSSRWEVFFPHAAVVPMGLVADLLDCPVAFEQPAAGFLIRPRQRRTAVASADLRRVQETLSQQLARGSPLSLAGLAHALAVSPRTLQRRLAQLGTSYQALVDGVRAAHALLLLRTHTVSQISESLGFAESVAFRRAFKRWTGVTPSDFRRAGTDRDKPLLRRRMSWALEKKAQRLSIWPALDRRPGERETPNRGYTTMRFISVFTHEPTGVPPTPELIAEMGKLIEDGMKAGWLVATEGVQWGEVGARVCNSGGEMTVVDGPFSEAKEVIGGYAILEAPSRAAVIELTRRFLKVAGSGVCEVHQLYQPPRA